MKQFTPVLHLVFLVLVMVNRLSGQELWRDQLDIKKNNIKILNSYSMVFANGEMTDSVLYRTYVFNEEGKIICNQKIDDRGTSKEIYKYESDTLLIEKDRIYNGVFLEKECYIYDMNKLVKIISLNENGDTMDRYSTFDYNSKGKLKDHKMYFGKKLGYHYTYKYHSNGKIKSRKTKRGFRGCTSYDENGNITKEVSDLLKVLKRSEEYYATGNLKSVVVEHEHKTRGKFGNGPTMLHVEKGDIEKIISNYNENGIINFHAILINNGINNIQHFHFITF